MLSIKYYKADASTFVILSSTGRIVKSGRGLSFFYNTVTSSIAAIPTNAQEAPFVFNLQTKDFQDVRIQGQLTFRVIDAVKISETLNFTLNNKADGYVSEDPLRLNDRIIRVAQGLIQNRIQQQSLREVLGAGADILIFLKNQLPTQDSITSIGLEVLEISLTTIKPNPETARALEAEAREAILKEADDAIYLRRISAVEQERSIKDAELQTDLSVQQKQQQIETDKLENTRVLMRSQAETERERITTNMAIKMEALKAEIAQETERQELVEARTYNQKIEANASAEATKKQAEAINILSPATLEALSLGNMKSGQVMALAMRTMAQNANKIGSLNFTPDILGQLLEK
jgi:hypothetical protein